MKGLRAGCLALFILGAGALHAQPPLVMDPPRLPMRNLLIEVRQDDQDDRASEHLDAEVRARLQPGQSGADMAIDAQRRQLARSGSARQQVLVLNGRTAAIALGNSVPLRLWQIIVRNGVRIAAPGSVWLQADTGFTATPAWDGSDTVYLELAATQSRLHAGESSASTSTSLMLPLGEWVTVADSEDMQSRRQGTQGLAGAGRDQQTRTQRLRVQVRISPH